MEQKAMADAGDDLYIRRLSPPRWANEQTGSNKILLLLLLLLLEQHLRVDLDGLLTQLIMVILMEALEVVLGKVVVEPVRVPMEATHVVVMMGVMAELVYG